MRFQRRSLEKLLASSACIAFLCAGVASDQATNSVDVTDTLTDRSGAVIPGVTVTIKDLDKDLEHTFATNRSGAYDTSPIIPEERYLIVFKRRGSPHCGAGR